MGEVIPRWEWRTFGMTFPSADEYLADLAPTGVQDSEEIYFLSAGGDTVKIRSAMLDIKLLREVVDGLELWEPMPKAEFPVNRKDLSLVFEALSVPPPTLVRDSYSQGQLLTEVIGPHRSVRVVSVAKHRIRYTFGRCSAECSEVRVGDRMTNTIAIESEDPEAVLAAVDQVGLGSRVNTNYPRGLGAILDG